LHTVVVIKGAVLDFAQRHELPSPSWWAVSASIPAEVPVLGLTTLTSVPVGLRQLLSLWASNRAF